jgi:hypothetical protein
LRDALIAELERLGSSEDATMWAHRNLAAKNRLTAVDATAVESAFAERLSELDQAERLGAVVIGLDEVIDLDAQLGDRMERSAGEQLVGQMENQISIWWSQEARVGSHPHPNHVCALKYAKAYAIIFYG